MTLPESPSDWIETLTRLAGGLGLNQTRVRWKLMAWRESWSSFRGRGRVVAQHVTYQHRLCPYCHTLQERTRGACVQCGRSLGPRFLEILGRLGIAIPRVSSVSSLLTLAIMACYLRVALAQGGLSLFSLDADVLVRFGGNYPPAVMAGEWWRLSTYIFLHAGLWHILFNLMALQQIGPQIEEVFGKGRMLFYFMLTGIVAGLGSELMGLRGVGIGASGSLMGLIGLAAGWGQRDGTSLGISVRDQMFKWGVYTLIFGFLIHADNAAHTAGFVSGSLLGFLSKPQWQRRGSGGTDFFFALAGAAASLGTLWLVMFPPGIG